MTSTILHLVRLGFLATLALLVATVAQSKAQSPARDKTGKSGALFEEIASMDAAIFDAFNAHDAGRLMTMFTEDLEFFHDRGGLSGFRETGESFKKLFENTPDIRRDLVPGSMEVYPVKDYGAIQIGEHRFCHQENGRDECGTFKFAMVWRKSGGKWQISRVLSYGH
jgi:ketosteroid isomerase-like protein